MADDDWFTPKRYGYGAGLPIRWQGWTTLAGALAALVAAVQLLGRRHPIAALGAMVLDLMVLWVIIARHTRGGLRWRWGDDR